MPGVRDERRRKLRVVIKGQHVLFWGFPGDSEGKKSACTAGDPGLTPGSGRSPGEGNGYPLQAWASLVAQRVKASACNVGNRGSIPGSGRAPGEGSGNPLWYSCLENPMDGEAL